MTAVPSNATSSVLTTKQQLVDFFIEGCKPPALFRIGTEHEKFTYHKTDGSPVPYEGEEGIGAFLQGMIEHFNWHPVYEGATIIALQKDGAAISLEPGGQLELSGAPLQNLHQTCNEVHTHLREVKSIGDRLNIAFLGTGFHPFWKREEMPWMPKQRYTIMKNYMPKKGSLGLDMMLRTCTIQVNLDYSSEADMIQKMRVGLALQPLATALFANAPLVEGNPVPYASYRSHIWNHTDNDRCGTLPFAFQENMSFERYVDYALQVPMYFVYRHGQYIDVAGQSFADFLAGKLPALPQEHPTTADWANHLSTLFPEVRLKQFLEMRGADGGSWNNICALPAFWVGLLYNNDALEAAWDIVKAWQPEDHLYLRQHAPLQGLETVVQGKTLQQLAVEILAISAKGLQQRACLNKKGKDESVFLEPLQEIATTGITPAQKLLASYQQTPYKMDFIRNNSY